MACGGCKRNKNVNKYGQVVIKKGKVTLPILRSRQNSCVNCPHSNEKQGGKLSIRSQCQISNRLLINALKDPKYKCPIDKFGVIKPK